MCNIHNFLGRLHINTCRLNQKIWSNQIQTVPQNSGSIFWELIWKDFFDCLCLKSFPPRKTIFVNSYLHIKLCILSRNMCKVKPNIHQKLCTLPEMSCNLHIIMCKTNSYYFILPQAGHCYSVDQTKGVTRHALPPTHKKISPFPPVSK